VSERCRITVDETRCAASTTCALVAPDLFAVPDGADSAQVKVAVVDDPELIALAREAEESCPTLSIAVETIA
jgi:ferredoxin